MSLRPMLSFYGSKWRDTPRLYPAPQHDTIIEPFAGAAGYSLRYPDRDVVLVERDPIIAGVWRYLIGADPQEILELPDVPRDGTVHDIDVPSESVRHLIGYWLNAANSSPCVRPSKWMREATSERWSFWGPKIRQRIAEQVPAIAHWQIIEGDYSEAPDIEATWFVDPPYRGAGRHYRFGSDLLDFESLGVWCRSRNGLVIVCENEGADWLPFTLLDRTKTTRAGKRSAEVAWISEGVAA